MQVTALREVQTLLGGEKFPNCESPSLRLEKFVRLGDNTKREEIEAVVSCQKKYGMEIPRFLPKGAVSFIAKLESRLIVNQAGGILENAGLCLHPHFGTPYIPGSAVKGVARHAAWCEWKEEEDETRKADIANRIAEVFGYPTGDSRPNKKEDVELGRVYLDDYLAERGWNDKRTAGTVAFLPAVPVGKGMIVTDILTPHGGNDWTEPVPNPFPVMEKGCEFSFTVVPLRTSEHFRYAVNWLKSGLTVHGAGAKSCAGYGMFSVAGFRSRRNGLICELRLMSPAFLRGAGDNSQGILRESTLRGLMRWWWRYLYRCLLNERELKKLEDFVWGGAGESPCASKIAIRIVSHPNLPVRAFDKETVARNLPRSFRQNRTTGIAYLSYGMDERIRGERKQRRFIEPNGDSVWQLEITTRNVAGISNVQVLDHAKLALSALCHFGGVGAKSRKGFGSFDCGIEFPDQDSLFTRMVQSIPWKFHFDDSEKTYAETGALHETVTTRLCNPWQVLDRIGYAMQIVASEHKHDPGKAVLGLPRQIHGPRREPLPHQRGHRHEPPVKLVADCGSPVRNRFTAPLAIHLSKSPSGGYTVNLTALPSGYVRDYDVSENLLVEAMDKIKEVLANG